jgi:hypothetical protein
MALHCRQGFRFSNHFVVENSELSYLSKDSQLAAPLIVAVWHLPTCFWNFDLEVLQRYPRSMISSLLSLSDQV